MTADGFELAGRIVEDCLAQRWPDARDRRSQLASLTEGEPADLRVATLLRRAALAAEQHRHHGAARDMAVRLRAMCFGLWTRAGRHGAAREDARALLRTDGPLPVGPLLLDSLLGEGAHSEVWAGRHGAGEIPVAVKVIKGLSRHGRIALENELRAVARLDHPNIVRLIDSGRVDGAAHALRSDWPVGTPVLVLERAPHGSLLDRVGTLPWPVARGLVLQVLQALAHAHARGVLHLDIKPANVLLGGRIRDPEARLADFGIAQVRSAGAQVGITDITGISGTPAYMAPEQLRGETWRFGPPTDLYAVGALAAALIQGDPPFVSENVQETFRMHLERRVPDLRPVTPVPEGLDGWVRRLMAKRPSDRFASGADAARALLGLGDQTRTSASPPRPAAAEPRVSLGDLPTVMLPAGAGPTHELPQPDTDLCPLPAPLVPASWRPDEAPQRPRPLLEETLGLFELREPRLVGRTLERAHLWAALRRSVERGRAQVVVVEGPPGIGVSTLLRWMGERTHEVGAARVVRISGQAGEPSEQALTAMLATELRTGALSGPDLRQRLEASLRSLIIDAVELDSLAAILDGHWRDDQGLRLCHRWLRRVAQQRPVLLCIDDAQWTGLALRWAVELAQAEVTALIVLGVSSEPPEGSAEAGWLAELRDGPSTVPLELQPLEGADLHDLARSLLPLQSTLRVKLVEAASGYPGILVDLLADATTRGVLRRQSRGFTLRPGAALEPSAPDQALTSRVHAALADLGSDAIGATRIAAALGDRVGLDLWSRACELAHVEPDPAGLVALSRANLLTEQSQAWHFHRPQARVTLLDPIDREHLRACAAALEPVSGQGPQRASLLRRAGDLSLAADAWLETAKQLEARASHDPALLALDQLEQVLDRLDAPDDDPRRAQLWLGRAGVHLVTRDPLAANEWLCKLEAGLERWPDWERYRGDVGLRRADHAYQNGDIDSWAAQLTDLLEWYRQADNLRGMGLVEHRLGVAERHRENLDAAMSHLTTALELLEPGGGPAWVVRTSLAHTQVQRGDVEGAREQYRNIAANAHPTARIDAVLALGELARDDDPDGALEYFTQARALGEASGTPSLHAQLGVIQGLCSLRRYEEAAQHIYDALPMARLAPLAPRSMLAAARLLVDVDAPETLFEEHLATVDVLPAQRAYPIGPVLEQAAERARDLQLPKRHKQLLQRAYRAYLFCGSHDDADRIAPGLGTETWGG